VSLGSRRIGYPPRAVRDGGGARRDAFRQLPCVGFRLCAFRRISAKLHSCHKTGRERTSARRRQTRKERGRSPPTRGPVAAVDARVRRSPGNSSAYSVRESRSRPSGGGAARHNGCGQPASIATRRAASPSQAIEAGPRQASAGRCASEHVANRLARRDTRPQCASRTSCGTSEVWQTGDCGGGGSATDAALLYPGKRPRSAASARSWRQRNGAPRVALPMPSGSPHGSCDSAEASEDVVDRALTASRRYGRAGVAGQTGTASADKSWLLGRPRVFFAGNASLRQRRRVSEDSGSGPAGGYAREREPTRMELGRRGRPPRSACQRPVRVNRRVRADAANFSAP
jgi:hypothetical protein